MLFYKNLFKLLWKRTEIISNNKLTEKTQTAPLDPSLTAETDEINASFPTSGPPVDPEEDEDENDNEDAFEEDADDEFPTREFMGADEDDPGLNHDENDDLGTEY